MCDSLLYDFSHLPRTTPAPNYLEDRVVQTMGAKEVVHKTTTVETKKAPSAANEERHKQTNRLGHVIVLYTTTTTTCTLIP